MMWEVMVVLLVLHACVPPATGYGESDASGHPNWQERANHVFLNAVRIAPSQYKTVYMSTWSPSPSAILGSTYPAKPPVRLEPKLVNAAFNHSLDMATHNCFAHNSCDGTSIWTRIQSFYTCSGTMGENIAAGYADPLDTNNQWLCDAVGSPSACAADGSGNDGHRSNIMGGGYTAVGVGYAYSASATYRHYWTQDFGGASCAPAPTSPVYGGSHRVKSGSTQFIAVYYTSPAVAPASATVFINGVSNNLALDIGASGAGTYSLSQTAGTSCRSYYFQFGSVRYPDTGCLVTYGEGSCTTSFDATCGGAAVAATTATTAAAAATTTTTTTAKAATTTTTSAKAATTTTTAKAVTTTTTASVTGLTTGASTYYLYSTALQNSWTLSYNSGVSITNSFTYNSVTGLKAVFATTSGNNFLIFSHSPAVTNVYASLQFYVAASASGNVLVYFNGGYYQSKAVTTAWQAYTIPLSSLGNPNTGGAPYTTLNSLVFQNAGSAAYTLYLSNVAFV